MVVIESLYMISTGLKRSWRLKLHPQACICACVNFFFLVNGGPSYLLDLCLGLSHLRPSVKNKNTECHNPNERGNGKPYQNRVKHFPKFDFLHASIWPQGGSPCNKKRIQIFIDLRARFWHYQPMTRNDDKLLRLPNGMILRCIHNGKINPKYGPEKHIVGSGRWMRDEIAIDEGRKSFRPDSSSSIRTPQSLGAIGNHLVKSTL